MFLQKDIYTSMMMAYLIMVALDIEGHKLLGEKQEGGGKLYYKISA
jgi:hypothetical protein